MAAFDPRPVYTDEQLSQYLELLFGSSHKFSDVAVLREAIATDGLNAVGKLQTQHLAVVPFSTVGFHYIASPITRMLLSPEDVFQKIVVRKQGGFCLEVNVFLSVVLRSLGVENYVTGGRISYNIGNTVLPVKRDPLGFDGW
jgi:arylamine N-acetyltransferase